MGLDRSALLGAIERLNVEMQKQFDVLNAADGKLGDGDLGITLTRGMEAIADVAGELPDDLGLAMLQCSQAFTKSSGSSYGTLMALAMMAIAKQIKGQTNVDPIDLNALVTTARNQIQTRGKAEIGGKTVLDSLDAVVNHTSGKSDLKDIRTSAIAAVDAALVDFHNKPATMGRARMFGEKSIGLNDPGMLAMKFIVYAIVGKST
ncbi:MAG: phosphatase [Flavobacteriales bacterium]|nr:phosphatase [Flavobacteriales bacterium]